MLTRKQHELIRFIQVRLEESGVSPSFEEMKEALDLKSKSGGAPADFCTRGTRVHSPLA